MSSGYAYILWNPSYRTNQFKIGKTSRHPSLRAKELSASTSTPQPFEVVYWAKVRDFNEAERLVHEMLRNQRISNNREFFEVELRAAISILDEVADKVGRSKEKESVGNTQAEAPPPALKVKKKEPTNISVGYHFRSRGPSAIVEEVLKRYREIVDPKVWKIGGVSSLTAVHLPATSTIETHFGKGLRAQIWIPRPENRGLRCTFEIASITGRFDGDEGQRVHIRESIAADLRNHISSQGLPSDFRLSQKSTILRGNVNLPKTYGPETDTPEKLPDHEREIATALSFLKFLDEKLQNWEWRAG